MSPKQFIEKKTGMLFGTYRWRSSGDSRHGPAPLFGFVFRPSNEEWVRIEIVLFGRAVYITWGHEAS